MLSWKRILCQTLMLEVEQSVRNCREGLIGSLKIFLANVFWSHIQLEGLANVFWSHIQLEGFCLCASAVVERVPHSV